MAMFLSSKLLVASLLVIRCGWICGQTTDLDLQCLRSSDPSLVQQLRLETVKQEILLRLHLDTEPANPDPDSLKMDEKLIMDEYNAVKKAAELNNVQNEPCVELETDMTELMVLFPTNVQTPGLTLPTESDQSQINGTNPAQLKSVYVDTYQLKFELDLEDKGEVFSAELRLFKIVQDDSDLGNTYRETLYDRVDVYLRITDVPYNWGEDLVLPITGLNVEPDTDRYVIFNVKKAIDEWIELTHSQKGEIILEVHIRSAEALAPDVSFIPHVQFVADNTTTQLVIRADSDELESAEEETISQLKDRSRRQSNVQTQYCRENPDVPQCCLRLLEINFERDLNWTWIIFPKSIPFNYCSGVCPIGWAITGEHSKFLTLLAIRSARLNNPVAAPNPCCVPNSFYTESVAIKTSPEESPRIEVLDNIVITSCVCR